MKSELDPDRIGRIGESLFASLCERAGLYCNKSAVDMMGWDFIVEFPMVPAGQSLSLDQRPISAARVQVKSTFGRGSSRIRLSLSAIDRLAKDHGPALIVVFRLREDGEPLSGYLVHLIGNELARILRRLRLAESRNVNDINHLNISYDYEKVGVRFQPTPAGLLAALSAACGQNPGAYMIEKQRQLTKLGYENGQFEVEALVKVDGPEHFSSLLLGLAPLKPDRLRVFDSRFGIRLPYQGTLFDDLEDMRLTPPTLGACEISVRGANFGQSARFDGEMFIGPPMAEPHGIELLARTADFIVRLTPPALKFESVGLINDTRRSLQGWAELIRALSLMATGEAILTISGNDRLPPITFPIDQPIVGPYLEELPVISSILDGWLKLLANAGLRSTAKFNFDTLWETTEAYRAVDILLSPKPQARFEFRRLETEMPSPLPEGVYFDNASFADTSITFSAKVFFEQSGDPEWPYWSTRFEALDVRPKVDDLQEYGMDQATAYGLRMLIDPSNLTFVSNNDSREAQD